MIPALRKRVAVGALTLSAGGFSSWAAYEGFTEEPVIPVEGDVPTIGYGSTRYEDGTRVNLDDPAITPERAEELARNLFEVDEKRFKGSIPGVELHQTEYDLYLDFVGQYGIANWNRSSMRRHLLAGNHAKACDALLMWRYAGGYDCSTRVDGEPNKRCWGVWKRQIDRHEKCISVQGGIGE